MKAIVNMEYTPESYDIKFLSCAQGMVQPVNLL